MNPLTDQRLTGPPSMMPYHPLSHTSTYQDTVSWPYAASWDTPLLDTTASEHPPPTALQPLGMVSPSHEGNTFVPPLPPPRVVPSRNHFLGAPQAPPFPASPTSTSPSDPRESSLQFNANPFASSQDIWPPHASSTGANVSVNPVTSTVGVTTSFGENLKGRVPRRSPTESTRSSSRYDPMTRQSRPTSRSTTAPESLTDEGDEERDSDGSVRDVRDKKRRYAKTFRDIEKQLFEKLRTRLFPQDPHAKRSECLERAIDSVDELMQLRDSEARLRKEAEDLRRQLDEAEHRIHLYRSMGN